MPSFAEYKEMARERGSLAYEVFIVTSRPIVPPEEFMKVLPDHLAFVAEQEQAGRIMLAGPLSDTTGEDMSGIGFQIWRGSDWDEVHTWATQDPNHVAGVKEFEMRRWLINEGSFQVTIGLSSRDVSLG